MHSSDNIACIVGAAESDNIGIVPNRTSLELHAEAARNALLEAGLELRDVDTLYTAGIEGRIVADYLGICPRHVDSTNAGGASFVMHVGRAADAIREGRCEVALITHGESGRSGVGFPEADADPYSPGSQYEKPFGHFSPIGSYALACSHHMAKYGTTRKHLAEIAVATRSWAALNPKAMKRDLLTIDEVVNARLIASPFGRLDCCLVTDAGGALVLTSLRRARDCIPRPVRVLGYAEAFDQAIITTIPDLASCPARRTGPVAFGMAGLSPSDIDVAQIYDSFTYTVLVSLEDLGFCAKGEGGLFVSGQRTAPGGNFPMNTSGGGLSYTHPGMFGIFTVIEAVRQLRHDYADQGIRQVPNAQIALAHGSGGVLSTAGTVLLGRD